MNRAPVKGRELPIRNGAPMRLSKIPEASLKISHAFSKRVWRNNTNYTLCSYMIKKPLGISPEGIYFFLEGILIFISPQYDTSRGFRKKSVFLRI
jgi:hypothetical protein